MFTCYKGHPTLSYTRNSISFRFPRQNWSFRENWLAFETVACSNNFFGRKCFGNLEHDVNTRWNWYLPFNAPFNNMRSSTNKYVFPYRQSNVQRLLQASDYCRTRGNQIAAHSSENDTVLGSSRKLEPPNIWLTVAKNAIKDFDTFSHAISQSVILNILNVIFLILQFKWIRVIILYILIVFTYFRFLMSLRIVYSLLFFYEILFENHNLYEKVISIKIIIITHFSIERWKLESACYWKAQ